MGQTVSESLESNERLVVILAEISTGYFEEGVLVPAICAAMGRIPVSIETIGVPHKVLSRYGTPEQHDEALGLTPGGIRRRIERFLGERTAR